MQRIDVVGCDPQRLFERCHGIGGAVLLADGEGQVQNTTPGLSRRQAQRLVRAPPRRPRRPAESQHMAVIVAVAAKRDQSARS